MGSANASFYTKSGLQLAKQHLAPRGILAVWSYSESSPFVEALRAAFEVVIETDVLGPGVDPGIREWKPDRPR